MNSKIGFAIFVPLAGIVVTAGSGAIANHIARVINTNEQLVSKAEDAIDYHGILGYESQQDGHALASYYKYEPKDGDISTYRYSELRGMLSYTVGDVTVAYDVRAEEDIQELLIVNGKTEYLAFYQGGDDYIDFLSLGNNAINYFYREDRTLDFVSANNLTIEMDYFDDKVRGVFIGDSFGDIRYNYENDAISEYRGINGRVSKRATATSSTHGSQINGNSIVFSSIGRPNVEFTLSESRTYVSSFTEGGSDYSLSYLNGRLVGVNKGDKDLVYVVDSAGNYLGCVYDEQCYLFVFDGSGMLREVLGEDGSSVLVYDTTPFGETTVYGNNAELADINCVLGMGLYGRPATGVCFDDSNFYFAPGQETYSFSDFVKHDSVMAGLFVGKAEYMQRDKLLGLEAIEGKIASDLRKRMTNDGFTIYQNVPVVDTVTGNLIDSLDLFFIDIRDDLEPNINNLRYQNTGYFISGIETGSSEEADQVFEFAKFGLAMTDLYQQRSFDRATYEVEGDLFYLSYAIHYHAKNGLITYELRQQALFNILGQDNVYDYDNERYVRYKYDEANAVDFDFSKIVPGLNRESYDIINGIIADHFRVAFEMEYDWSSGVDLASFERASAYEELDDTIPLLDNGVDTGSYYIAVDAGGGIKVATLPWYEHADSIKAAIKIAGATVAVAVASVVCVYCPGIGSFLMPITVGFIKGFIGSMLINSAFTAFDIIMNYSDDPNFDVNIAIAQSFNSLTDQALKAGVKSAVMVCINLGVNAVVQHNNGMTSLSKEISRYERDYAKVGYGSPYGMDAESYEYYIHYQLEYARKAEALSSNFSYKVFNFFTKPKKYPNVTGALLGHLYNNVIVPEAKELCENLPLLKYVS